MCEVFIIFMLCLIVTRLYNVTIVKFLHDGYYLFYEVKEFDPWYKKFNIRTRRICLWRFKHKDYDDSIF